MKAETSIQSEEYLATDKDKSKQKKIALHFKKIELINEIKSRIKNIYENSEPEEILIYGLNIFFFESEYNIKKGIIYINEKEENSLTFLDLKSRQPTRIQLSKLSDINLGKNSGNFKVYENKIKKIDEQRCLTMYMKDKTKFSDLIFNTKEDLDLFCLGIANLLEKNINEAKNLKRDIISLKQIWKQYVSDQDKKHLNFQQFSKFLRTICFKWKKKTDEQVFNEIDVKKQGKINFKDFISFYEFLVTGEEFTEIFQKYSSDEEKKYITIRGLLDFMEKEQHLKVSMQDIFTILHKFSKKGRKMLESTGLLNNIRDGVIDAEEYANNINDLNQEKNNENANLNNDSINNNECEKNNKNNNEKVTVVVANNDLSTGLNSNLQQHPLKNNCESEVNHVKNDGSNVDHNSKVNLYSNNDINFNLNKNNNVNNKNKNNAENDKNNQHNNIPNANSNDNQNKSNFPQTNIKVPNSTENIQSRSIKSPYSNQIQTQNTKNQKPNSNINIKNNIINNPKGSAINLNSNNKNNIDHESLQAIYDNYSFGKNNILDEIKEGKNEDLYSAFCLSFREFVNFLIDKSYNSIYNHDLFSLHQNMNLPINDYFIYSSHNTYLEGNQMIGNSSIDMYVNCLKNGCRLVELDCWDGKNGPIITHWHFPVNKLDLKEVLVIINDIAFKKSPYPVIFSIENHCNNTSQEMMAQYFLDVIGKENLYIVDTENPPLAYPSPNDLQRKFIIKCKRKRILGKKENFKKLVGENNNNNNSANNNFVSVATANNNINNINNFNLSANQFPIGNSNFRNSYSNYAPQQANNFNIAAVNSNFNNHNFVSNANNLNSLNNNNAFYNVKNNNNSGNNSMPQQGENNSFFCNLEADSIHLNQNNVYFNNYDRKIVSGFNSYKNQEKVIDQQPVTENVLVSNNNPNIHNNLNNQIINNKNKNDNNCLIVSTKYSNNNINNNNCNLNTIQNKNNINSKEENQNANINSNNNQNSIPQQNQNLNSNIEENKKNILRMVQKEEIIEEVNSVNSLGKNTSYNEGQFENLLDSSNEKINITTDRYQTRETALITCINENKKLNRDKIYQQKIQNIYENKKIHNPISKIKKIDSVENLRNFANMSPLDKAANLSNVDDNLNNYRIHSFIEVNKMDVNNFKEFDEEMDEELMNDFKIKSKFEVNKKQNLQIFENEKEKEIQNFNCKKLSDIEEDFQLINKNFSLSSTDFTSKRNYIKNKLDFGYNNNYKNNNADNNLNNENLNKNIGNESVKHCNIKKNNHSCFSQKNINEEIQFKKIGKNLNSVMGWDQKIQIANEEIKKVLKNKTTQNQEENTNLENKNNKIFSNNKIENEIVNNNKEKDCNENYIFNNNNNKFLNYNYNLNTNTNESNKNNTHGLDTPADIKRNSIKNNKIEKGNLKYITNTGILNLNPVANEEEDLNSKRKISDNNKDDIAVKIKYLAENKELKFKHLNIEIKDPPLNPNNLDSENNPNGFTHTNFYEVYKIKTKKKKKKSLINLSLESEVSDARNEMQISQPTNSNKVFKNLKVKYLINDNFKPNNNPNTIQNENNLNNNNLINNENQNLKAEGDSHMNIQTIITATINNNNNLNNNNDFEVLTRMHEIRTIDELKPSTIKIKTIDKLAAIVGMIGVKYKQSDFDGGLYLPWECVSIAEPDFNKYIVNIEERIKLIKFCQKAFIKTYPDVVKRTNSSNHDPIVCWASGVQIVALNLQKTDDDMILINKIFFKLNGGSKSGYILKPELLRNPSCDELVKKMCGKVAFKIKFKVLSGFHLHLCFPEKTKITGLYVEVSLRSAYSDSENKKLVTNTIENNYLHPIWVSSSVHFEVFDPDLSFIIIKVFSKKKTVIARSVIPVKFMNLGIRVVDLYDNYCSKFENSFLIVKCNKILVDK